MGDNSTETDRSERLQRLRTQIGQSATPGDTSASPVSAAQETHLSQVQQPQQTVTPPSLRPGANLKGLGQPSSHDRRSQVPFDARYKKENVMVDRRLLTAYFDLMSRLGRSKVESFNAMLLDVLIEAGYPLDPHLLERPFQWEDLPK